MLIDSAEVQQAVVSHMRDVIGPLPHNSEWDDPEDVGFWVGGSDLEEGVWRFINGTKLPVDDTTRGFQKWHEDFEGNIPPYGVGDKAEFSCMYISAVYNDREAYRIMDLNGTWFDTSCWYYKHAICQSDTQRYGKCFDKME